MKVALTVSLIGFIIFGFVFLRVRNKRRAAPETPPETKGRTEVEKPEGECGR